MTPNDHETDAIDPTAPDAEGHSAGGDTGRPGVSASPIAEAGRIPRNIWWLGMVSLLTDASSEMVYPVLPLFLANVLGAPVAAIGLIESVAEATSSISRVFSGWLSDRIGRRKPLVVTGYTFSNVMKPLLAVTASWPAVLALRFADRLGKGIRTAPRDALIADSGTAQTRGRDFGAHRALDTIGAAIGPLTAWAILTLSPGAYRTIFLISAVPGTLAVVLALVAVRDTRRDTRHDAARGARGPEHAQRHPLQLRHLGVSFVLFTGVSAIFALGNSSDAMLVLRAQNIGAPAALVPLMYFAFNVVAAALATPMGRASDRIGRRRMIVGGFLGYAAVYAGFALAGSQLHAWLLFALYGIPYAMTEGLTRAYVVDLVSPQRRGTAVGGYTFVLGLAALPASTMAGILWDRAGHGVPFAVSAGLMAASAIALAALGPVFERHAPAH